MIPFLGLADPFPPIETALTEPDGLLAAGGGLSVRRLVDAYSRGIFPWFNAGDPVLWWSPDPRTVLRPRGLHLSRSLRRRLRQPGFTVTADTAFDAVLDACAAPRDGAGGTWLVPAMRRAYAALHRAGFAHSVEVWMDDVLAGGIYGVALGRMFFGESMFSARTDGSKIAMAYLAAQLDRWECPLIDCQLENEHLVSLGAVPMPRAEFLREVAALVQAAPTPAIWSLDPFLQIGGRAL
ncbi:MAG: leucyl/phenylalanyl-tRNA--protein transferase [Vicinamibacterales bacterium]